MRRTFGGVAVGALVLGLASSLDAQRPAARATACEPGPLPLPVDTLQALAKRLHPEAVALTPGDSLLTVGLVFDASCRLTHHAVGRRTAVGMSVDTAFAQIMPGVRVRPWRAGGFAVLAPGAPLGAEIAWVVLRADAPTR